MRIRSNLRALFCFFVPFAVGTYMLFLSWRRWPDILVDFGRELYIPWQISQGAALYKDLPYLHGLLSPYLNAFLFRVFGTGLLTLALFNIFLILAIAFIIYRVFLKITDRLTSVAATVSFLALFAFSQYVGTGNYNFVCPYAHGLTHGIFLTFCLFYALLTYLENRKNWLLAICGLLMGLIFLAKAEVFIAAGGAFFAAFFFMVYLDKPARSGVFKLSGFIAAGFLMPLVFSLVGLAAAMPLKEAVSSLLFQYSAVFGTPVSSGVFYRRIMGLDCPLRNSLRLILAAAWYIAAALDLWLISQGVRRFLRHSRFLGAVIIFCGLGFLAELCFVIIKYHGQMFRPLPLVVLVAGVYSFVVLLRFPGSSKEAAKSIMIFSFAVFSFLLIVKMLLNARIYHFGFVLAMPAALVLVAVFIYYLPRWINRGRGDLPLVRFFSVVLLAVVLAVHMGISRDIYRMKNYSIGSGPDMIRDFGPPASMRALYVSQAIDWIKKTVGRNETFVVFPEGVMLNYLLRKKNTSGHINFMLPEMDVFGERQILDSLARSSPDYIVLIDKDMSEYGCRFPGRDCLKDIMSWIADTYSPATLIGKRPFTGAGFGIIIAKRTAR